MRAQLQIGSGLCWAVAWALAVAAPALYLAGGTWFVFVLQLPVVALALWREELRGGTPGGTADLGGGPWGPPGT
jgi:hypothetical protein